MRTYICIDLKSFYASVECVERGLDPLTTNLVVADASKTEKTICLAVTPSLKAFGIPGRARLFEVIQKVREVNINRKEPITYITAPPRMALYMKYSTEIYEIYLKYVAPEDIHVYSVDEVFMDVTNYLRTLKMTPKKMAETMVKDVLKHTGITATAGIGSNMYLAKVAMDIVAKHIEPDKDGVRIAELDEMRYRDLLWEHTPITDFWRVGKGTADRLKKYYIFTMGDVAKASLENEDLLYKLLGVNAETLIDHAWGYESCTMKDIKSYKPESKSLSYGQVLSSPYSFEKARIVIHEMADIAALDLVSKKIVTDQVVLTVGYDVCSAKNFRGEIKTDRYGRKVPRSAHGTINIDNFTSSSKLISKAVLELFDRITDESLFVRRMNISLNHLCPESEIKEEKFYQLDFFTDHNEIEEKRSKEKERLEKEKKVQKAMIDIKYKYGKNAVLKIMNLQDGATAMERNRQIGGHNA